MGKGTKQLAIGAAIAAGVGYLAGILTAPKSGKETRHDIANATVKAKKQAEKQLKQLHAELNDVIAEAKKIIETLKSSAKSELDDLVNKAQVAKEKVRGILSAIHEGESDDKDLDGAIKEVTEALDDLKSYLAKHDKKA